MIDLFYEYIRFYQKFAVNWWNHIGPKEYVILLTLVGVIGFISMLRGSKRISA